MPAQGGLQPLPQRRRSFYKRIVQRLKKLRKLLLRPIQHVARKQPTSGAKFQNLNTLGRTSYTPDLLKLPGQQATENGMDVAGRIEFAGLDEPFHISRVRAQL